MATFYNFFETSHSLRAERFWFELELVVKWFSSSFLLQKHVFFPKKMDIFPITI